MKLILKKRKLVTYVSYLLLDPKCGSLPKSSSFTVQDLGKALQHKINLGLSRTHVFGLTSLWQILKFLVIQPLGLDLKHLEFHLHLCSFQMIKMSFVLNLVHCVLNGIINT
jgi:RNAse (barnase) inhibitor barstar